MENKQERAKGYIGLGHKPGTWQVYVYNDDTCGALFPESKIPIGDTKYESRHGVGTASGLFPFIPVNAEFAKGDLVEVVRVVKVINVPKAPPWARKLFFVEIVVTETASDISEKLRKEVEAANRVVIKSKAALWHLKDPMLKDHRGELKKCLPIFQDTAILEGANQILACNDIDEKSIRSIILHWAGRAIGHLDIERGSGSTKLARRLTSSVRNPV